MVVEYTAAEAVESGVKTVEYQYPTGIQTSKVKQGGDGFNVTYELFKDLGIVASWNEEPQTKKENIFASKVDKLLTKEEIDALLNPKSKGSEAAFQKLTAIQESGNALNTANGGVVSTNKPQTVEMAR